MQQGMYFIRDKLELQGDNFLQVKRKIHKMNYRLCMCLIHVLYSMYTIPLHAVTNNHTIIVYSYMLP